LNQRRIGWFLGLLAALLFGIAGLVDLGSALFASIGGHVLRGIGEAGSGIVELVVAVVTLVVAGLSARTFARFELAGGLILLVLVVLEAVVLGFSGSLLTVLGVIFSAISGVLFVTTPGAIRRVFR